MTTLREKLIKIGANMVRHAKCVTFQLAEAAVPRELFAAILERIRWFGVPPPLVQPGWASRSHERPDDSRAGKGVRCAETGGDRRSAGGKSKIGMMERSDGQESHQDGLIWPEIEYIVRIGALVKV